MSHKPTPSSPSHLSSSMLFCRRKPRFQSTNAYKRNLRNRVTVLPMDPVVVGCADPMNTKGALEQSTGPCPGPPAHRTSLTAPVDGSFVALTTLREKYDSMGNPTTFAWPAVVNSDGTPPRLMILLCAVA